MSPVDPDHISEADFDRLYGQGCYSRVLNLINALGPSTRRDSWWSTSGPYEIIAHALVQERHRPTEGQKAPTALAPWAGQRQRP
jgi:hypothetical protein